MAQTTYIATAPDGTELTRKTDRTYTHAVLLEGKEGWGIAGFCGRLDLAQKKSAAHPGSLVVECCPLGGVPTDETAPEVTEEVEPTAPDAVDTPESEQTVDQKIATAKVHGPEPKRTIGSLVQELLMDGALDYLAIVDRVVAKFPDAKTSVRSVASVAAVLRKKGVDVPLRRKVKSAD